MICGIRSAKYCHALPLAHCKGMCAIIDLGYSRASAIEFLDNLLRPGLKEILLPLLEEVSLGVPSDKVNRFWTAAPASLEAHLERLISGRDAWLRTVAIYVVGSLRLTALESRLRQEFSRVEKTILPTLQWSLARFETV